MLSLSKHRPFFVPQCTALEGQCFDMLSTDGWGEARFADAFSGLKP
jgi:hypothetical protein